MTTYLQQLYEQKERESARIIKNITDCQYVGKDGDRRLTADALVLTGLDKKISEEEARVKEVLRGI